MTKTAMPTKKEPKREATGPELVEYVELFDVHQGDVPLLRGYIHRLLAITSPVAMAYFARTVADKRFVAEYAIACGCCMLNFLSSAILHYREWDLKRYDTYMKTDYAFIFVMIGGSALPASTAIAVDDFGVLAVLIQWVAVAIGAVGSLAFKFVKAPAVFRVMVYFAVGTPYLKLCHELYRINCLMGLLHSLLTMIIYIVGGIVYATKMPNPLPHFFGFHELFHMCCATALITTFAGNHYTTLCMASV